MRTLSPEDVASEPEELLGRQRAELGDAYLQAVRRLHWDSDRLAAERERRLRRLLGWAVDRSDFWRERLAGRDPATFTEADLPSLPVLTKDEMMTEFDRLVTVPGLTLARANAHVERADGATYLDGGLRVLATSGTGGRRGLVVYGWEDWVTFAALATRWRGRCGDDIGAPLGSLYARSAKHVSGALHSFVGFGADDGGSVHLPATLAVPDIVASLNVAQPTQLQGYPSIIRVLAEEALAGRLHLTPTWVSTCGEQCTDEVRAAAREAWDVELSDVYGCTEGIYAYPCDRRAGMHLPDDLAILEPVDGEGKPVPFGQPAERVLLTNLYNRVQPLVRYELTDAMTLVDDPCPCGCAHRRIAHVRGRTFGAFRYGPSAVVQCAELGSILLSDGGVAGMQVTQTQRGARAFVTAKGPVDTEHLAGKMVRLLRSSGVDDPEAEVRVVDSVDRLWSGKARQFEPLAR